MSTTPPSLAVVTGAAGGIGAALAKALQARGARLVLADIDSDALDRVAARTGSSAVPTDVADPDAVEALAGRTEGASLVCLNAGVVGTDLGAPWEVSARDWNRVFDVNVGGVVNGLRAFVPRLLAVGRPAHVLVTASLAGLTVFPGGGAYGPSKHAVVAVVEHAAMALAGTPVTISMICPALVATGMSSDGVAPESVAAQALDALDAGIFAVVPAEWRAAVVREVDEVASGCVPTPPAPS